MKETKEVTLKHSIFVHTNEFGKPVAIDDDPDDSEVEIPAGTTLDVHYYDDGFDAFNVEISDEFLPMRMNATLSSKHFID